MKGIMKMKENFLKVLITTIGSVLSSMLGILYVPVLLMVACNITDYITGLMAASHRADGIISSYKSIRGITKKVAMWILVVVGAMIDCLIKYAVSTLGYQLPFTFLVACIVAIWIVCNELISILENLIDVGIAIPAFLIPLVKNIKSYAEAKVELPGAENDDNREEEK